MSDNGQSRILSNIVSPYGLAMISYAFFLFACLIPPSIYTHYMKEPDLMFLNPATILFYTLCVASFVAGVWLIGWLFPTQFVDCKIETKISPVLFLLLPLIAGIALTNLSSFLLARNAPMLVLLLISQRGMDIKGATGSGEIEGALTFATPMLIGVTWWAFWRYQSFGLLGWRKQLLKVALVAAVLSVIVSATLILSRNLLMVVVCGLAILYVIRRTVKDQINFKFIYRMGIAIAGCVTLLFFAFSFLRGTDSWDGQVNELFGYTVACYNRLAAIMDGSLRYPFAGHGIYLSYFAAYSHVFNRIVPLAKIMNPPEFVNLWGSEFGAVSRAGLDGRLIWAGAFGYIYSELGWFSCLFLFGYGMIYGVVWDRMKSGKVLGAVLYPFFGFCVLFWMGTNYLFDELSAVLLFTAIILAGYEVLFVRPADASRLP